MQISQPLSTLQYKLVNHYQPFLKGIHLKVNIIEQLEFELAYNYVTVQLVSHYTYGDPPRIKKK